ncbi:hypothetical protein GQ44DRAFT_828702 [Phaeosphaeriaceae sp. PMI808]|nr:hypothetical protein GQ44DRAFT_828702 [Phaeosphaeriaceae sp. PMI808]
MAFKLQPGVKYISHEDPEHDCMDSMHKYDSCGQCECTEVKEVGQHCQHCYHCPPCSSAVAIGCRPCTSSPDKNIYRSYIARHRKRGNTGDSLADRDGEDLKDLAEWYSYMEMELPQLSDIELDSPPPLNNEEDVAVDQVESKKTPRETSPKQ